MRLTFLTTLAALISFATLAGCAPIPTGAPVDCTITELASNCPAWIRQ